MKKRYFNKLKIIIPIVGAYSIISIIIKLLLKLPPISIDSVLSDIAMVIVLMFLVKDE